MLFFFYYIANFILNFIIFIKKCSSFIEKCLHLVLSKSLLYIHTFGWNTKKGLLYLGKKKLNRYYCFINIYIAYRNTDFTLMKFIFFNFSIIKFYNFLSIFIDGLNIFYNFLINDFLLS